MKQLDTSGLKCPYPLAKAKLELKNMQAGELLEIISTDPASVIDFKVHAEISGDILLKHYQEGHNYFFVIKKS